MRNNASPADMNGNAARKIAPGGKVLIYPAVARPVWGKRVYFLFCISQIKYIIMDVKISEAPELPPHICGVTRWRKRKLPVIWPEMRLGLALSAKKPPRRFLAAEFGKNGTTGHAVVKAAAPMRIESLPLACQPAQIMPPFDNDLVAGAYHWEDGILVVPDLNTMLAGKTIRDGSLADG